MTEKPWGTVTFLFTDLEGSTRLWEEHPGAMQGALARHDEILRNAIAAHHGHLVKMTGDGAHAAFVNAQDAIGAAVAAQRALSDEAWGEPGELRVRMGIHTGPVEARDGDYFGTAVNRAARLMSAANGGQIVVSLATEELLRDVSAGDVVLVDLGEHRLRDLARAERAFQLEAPGLRSDFPPLRSLDAYEGNLPPQLTSFIGRVEELTGIAKAYDDARLVTLTGVGGVGKTRLAVQVAAELVPGYPDGAWLCELAAAHDDETMGQVVAVSLGVQTRAGMTTQESIVDYLRTKHLLLVLDNCEHLLDAAGALAAGILRACRGVRLLATSREGLAVEGEHVWPLRSLPFAELSSDVETMVRSDAVRLFVERARAARSGFMLDGANVSAIAEICRRLDGIPLAIELAAARVVGMRPSEIAALLDERFRLLTGGRRTSVERHQTLRATVEWSYALLTPEERTTFDRLGVFVGSFDGRAAVSVVTDDEHGEWTVHEALTSLVAKSMVVDEEGPGGTTRYQLLETLRHFAREQLEATSEPDVWRRAHAAHYATLAEEIGPALHGPDELAWRPRFRAELDNLRAAVMWSLNADDDADGELALRIIAALAEEAAQDQAAGVGAWAERAMARADTAAAGLRFAVLGAAAWRAWQQADFESGKLRALDALRDTPAADWPCPHWAYIALALCRLLTDDGDAHAVIEEGNRVLRSAGASPRVLTHLHVSGVSAARGNPALVRAEAEAGLRYAREAGNPTGLAVALYGWAESWYLDDPDAALAALDESIALTRAGASDGVFGFALALAVQLEAGTDQCRENAIATLRDAIAYSVDLGDRPMVISACARAFQILAAFDLSALAAVFTGIAVTGPLAYLCILDPSRPDAQQATERVRAELTENEYERAVSRGAAMSYYELCEFALAAFNELLSQTESRDE